MISLACTHCKTVLQIDDAFAGGVCRCQHCGTIQTVPSHLRSGSPAPSSRAKPQKALYRSASAPESTPGTGLDELADVVASSGLSGSGLASNRLRHTSAAAATAQTPPNNNRMLIYVAAGIGGALAVLLVVVLIVMLTRAPAPVTTNNLPPPPPNPNQITPGTPTGPHYATLPLAGATSVVYVLDRGDASSHAFDAIKGAAIDSLRTLGDSRKFQIIFWERENAVVAFPPGVPISASAANIASASGATNDVFAFGPSEALPAVKQAIASHPSDIVLVTAKGWQLEDVFAKDIRDAAAKTGIRIHTVSVGSPSPVLQSISAATNGKAVNVSEGQLQSFMP